MTKNNKYVQDHPIVDLPHVIYDAIEGEYYNTKSDIFLTEDDIACHKLRPYSQIDNPLPKPLPPDYFTNWKPENPLKEHLDSAMNQVFGNDQMSNE